MPAERAGLGAALLVVGASCSFGAPEPIPLAGPAPRTILVFPAVDDTGRPEIARQLALALAEPLQQRGYVPLPVESGLAQLVAAGFRPTNPRPGEECAAAAAQLGADAFLVLRIARWDAVYAPALRTLAWDLGYELWDASSAQLLWQVRSRDAWVFDARVEHRAPDLGLDDFAETPSHSTLRTEAQSARAVHGVVLGYLPRAP